MILFGLLLGGLAGSFLATLAIRWGRSDSIARGRSQCDSCHITIPARHLVPVVSFLVLHGRCRACGAAIDRRQPAMELVCALIGGAALAVRPDASGFAGALFGWILATLALLDLDHFWLPDALVIPLGLAGLCGGWLGWDPSLPDRLGGTACGFVAFTFIAWAYRRLRGRVGLGQGDAKLLASIGAWLGWRALPWVVLIAALAGIAVSLIALVRGRRIALADRLPLGTLLALAAWPCWLAGRIAL
jgi:leader peptidase (prepilin peptidase)/N-methyltransferase